MDFVENWHVFLLSVQWGVLYTYMAVEKQLLICYFPVNLLNV